MEKGDIAVISYTATDKTSNTVFDSTKEEQAKKAGIFDEKTKYSPITIVIGNNELMKALEEEIKKMKAGEEKKIPLTAENAFGERKSELIKVLPMKEFIARNIRPVPGLAVELNNMRGRIQSVSGGRVRVDFNHELAGKELEYEIRLEKVITEKKEKLEALKERFFGKEAKASEEKDAIEIVFDGIVPHPQIKADFVQTVFSGFSEVKKIRFTEEIQRKEAEKEKEPAEAKTAVKKEKQKKASGKEQESTD
ncbi:MAG: peptidylprolyl isomerase [archaeon]